MLGFPFDSHRLGVMPTFRKKARHGHTMAFLEF